MVRYPASAEKGWRLESSILGVNAHKELDERREGHQEEYAGESDMVAIVGVSTLETFELNLAKASAIVTLSVSRTVGEA